MKKKSPPEKAQQIRDFIISSIASNRKGITLQVSKKFRISRQAAHRYLRLMVREGTLRSKGNTRTRTYSLKPLEQMRANFKIESGLGEDTVWREQILPVLLKWNIADNVLRICEYGFTEILNNAIEHSEGTQVTVELEMDIRNTSLTIKDNGIGIFTKIQREFNLEHPRLAILELAKGKLTTDPSHHTGEGIFFSSRAFDTFSILSDTLSFTHSEVDGDWVRENLKNTPGTHVKMGVGRNTRRVLRELFDKYASPDRDYSFSKTHVPVQLVQIGKENLVSRSQARRLLTRFEKFDEIILDFRSVDEIGQAFADEVFRVFVAQQPKIRIVHVNANKQIQKMIKRARSSNVE